MAFDWQNNLHLEKKEIRTHDTKHFSHPTEEGKMICIQSFGLLHAYTDNGFEDIEKELPNFEFKEGTQIEDTTSAEQHFIMDLPSWGRAEVEENGDVIRVYDKKGKSIFRYQDLTALPRGEKPYFVVDKQGKKTPAIKNDEHDSIKEEKTEKNPNAKGGKFQVIDNKMYVKFTGIDYPVDVYDDTDTASTNSGDTYINHAAADQDTVYGASQYFLLYSGSGGNNNYQRVLIDFALSSGTGTISKVELFLYKYGVTGGTDPALVSNLHQLTQTAWVESEATWNSYSTGNSWTTAGGDYSATVVDSFTFSGGSTTEWANYVLMGTGATNPLTLNWGDSVHSLIKCNTENATEYYGAYIRSKEYTTAGQRPYLVITYTPSVANTSNFFLMF